MPFDPSLTDRVRKVLARHKGIAERKMFGGLAFLIRGNMCCGILGKDLIVRLGREGTEEALREPHTRAFDFTGTPMKTLIYIAPPAVESDEALRDWVRRALDFARSLPAK
jgi:TfoX/Sxy family transcriptional regulator of competence genes